MQRQQIPARRRRGFTLVELLVVIAIIGLLVSMLMPAVQRARESARRSSCINNLRQISIGTHNYLDSHHTFPSGWIQGDTEGYRYIVELTDPMLILSSDIDESVKGKWIMARWWSWQALILNYIDKQTLAINFQIPEKHSPFPNRELIQAHIETYVCPTAPLPKRTSQIPGYTSYRGNVGYWPEDSEPTWNGLFHGNSEIDDRDIIDGMSQTLMFGEAQYGMFWSDAYLVGVIKDEYGDPPFDRFLDTQPDNDAVQHRRLSGAQAQPPDEKLDMYSYGSFHGDVINFAYADASVHTLSKTINGKVFRAMCTRNGREPIGDFED